ncbi:DUF2087 domain-containing protein [Halobacterium rubrum]|uniref:DUF2087 domain-containing protein n=1 Tax=Halobacterium TaxID=2239 RepID=UPI001F17B6E8|nr:MULTISPECIES: DUF2087 domain-containing protein [Halobacterium]MDH5018687.1 DUF2087 domain-containing protein [Halobacterium rubrum]
MALSFDRDWREFFETRVEADSLPGNDALKLVVLEELLDEFEVGETYSKAEVNATLGEHFGDHVTVRRELVNFGYVHYDNTTNEYTVVKRELSEAEVRERTRLERHARDVGVLE